MAVTPSQVRVPPGADWFIDRDDKGQRLKLELNEPAAGKLDLAVSGSLVRDTSQAEFAVPGVTAEEVQAQRGQLAIYLDDDLDAVLVRDGGARPIDPAALDSALRPDDERPVHYAFQYESPPQDLRLRLSPASSRLNADVTTVVSVREGAAAYISQVDFEIRQAGQSRFQVVTPQWLGDDIELQGDQIRQVRSRVNAQQRTWDIELQQPVRGTYRLHLVQSLPLADDGTVRAAIIRPLDVERSRSHLVLENVTADEIAESTIRGAAPISIAEVPGVVTDNVRRQAVAAYRIADDAADLVWQRRVRQHETGLKASINLADLTTVVHADGRYRARAAYNIRNFTLQFLELELPPNSEVWSVHVSGQPVRPAKILRQGRTVTLLPLQKTSAGDFSSKVVVVYSGRLPEALNTWTQVQPPAPEILSDVPVSRTLWTVFLPEQYAVSLDKGESNLEQVAAAYQREERKLSFLDELREITQVASLKGKSAARTKARENLLQIGSALQEFAQQSALGDARNAAEVQEQARQIEAEIKRFEELKADTKRADADPALYFKEPQPRPEGVPFGAERDRFWEKFPEVDKTEAEIAAPKEEGKKPPDQGGRPEERRGDLRKQAAAQLEKLQRMQQEEPGQQKQAAPPPAEKPPTVPEGKPEPEPAGVQPAAQQGTGTPTPRDERTASLTPAAAAGTGRLSLDLDVAPVGTAHYFRKLHGQPRLVLRARHEDWSRLLFALVWAGLCVALATVVVQVLRRPNAAALARRNWPWLAAVAGTAWWFLLPAGVFGLALLVTALCTLIARSR